MNPLNLFAAKLAPLILNLMVHMSIVCPIAAENLSMSNWVPSFIGVKKRIPLDTVDNSLQESANAGTLAKVWAGCSFGLNLTSLVTLAMTTNRKRTDGRTISKRVNIKWRLLTQAYFSVSMPACLENLIVRGLQLHCQNFSI